MASLIQTLAVAEYLNFRHAANALGVAQPSISARVRMLEEDLGVLLFERHTRGVRLTEAGRAFVEQISSGVDQIDHAVKAAGIAATGERGRLRIGIHGLIPGSFLDGLLTRFRLEHPAIIIEVVEGSARETITHLRARRIDVAFLVGTFDLPDCHSRPIWTEPLIAAMGGRPPACAALRRNAAWSGEPAIPDSRGCPAAYHRRAGPHCVLGDLVAVRSESDAPKSTRPSWQDGTSDRGRAAFTIAIVSFCRSFVLGWAGV
jgi:DNA-binding transcriptional LysR family regulator